MRTLEIDESTSLLGVQEQNADEEPLILTHEGRPYAALVPLDEFSASDTASDISIFKRVLRIALEAISRADIEDKVENEFIDTSPELRNLLAQRYKSMKAGKVYSLGEVCHDLGIPNPTASEELSCSLGILGRIATYP